MGCCLSFGNNKSRIEIIDQIPKGKEFNYLRPEGKITYSINTTYDVPRIEFDFNDWYVNSVRLWSGSKKFRPHLLMLRRTPLVLPQISFSSGSLHNGIDTDF